MWKDLEVVKAVEAVEAVKAVDAVDLHGGRQGLIWLRGLITCLPAGRG